jgi:hypothetical protein
MKQADLKRLALLMAAICVRNTVIEDYHAQGKLDDSEMKAFNQEVANKIYTFLHYWHKKPSADFRAFLLAMDMMYPSSWDQPKIDREFVEAAKLFKGNGTSLGRSPSPDVPSE